MGKAMMSRVFYLFVLAGLLQLSGALAGESGQAMAADEAEHDAVAVTPADDAHETSDGVIEFGLEAHRQPDRVADRAPAILTRSQLLKDLEAFYTQLAQLGVTQQRSTGEYAACDMDENDESGLTNYLICLQSLGSPRRGQGP
jgi:hypothetical protein